MGQRGNWRENWLGKGGLFSLRGDSLRGGSLRRFSVRLVNLLLTLFVVLSLIFLALRLTPGDPIEKILGPLATFEEIENYRRDVGLNAPLGVQYVEYMKGLLRGDLGRSLFKNDTVLSLMKAHLPPTFFLALSAIFCSTLLGILLGTLAGAYRAQVLDRSLRLLTLLIMAVPIFSLAPILVYLFSVKLGWLPVSEWTSPSHFVLPLITLVMPLGAIITKVTRNKYLEEVSAPWVLVLKSKGLGEKEVCARVVKVCLPSIFSVVAIQLSVVLAGTMITETIFDIPGIGLLLFEGIQNRDYPLVQGVISYSTLIYMVIYFVVDWVNEKLDPRLARLKREAYV